MDTSIYQFTNGHLSSHRRQMDMPPLYPFRKKYTAATVHKLVTNRFPSISLLYLGTDTFITYALNYFIICTGLLLTSPQPMAAIFEHKMWALSFFGSDLEARDEFPWQSLGKRLRSSRPRPLYSSVVTIRDMQ